jgi:hypothetical protein
VGLFGTISAIAEMAELRRRTADVASRLRSTIEAEGGVVEAAQSLNSRLILHSPFPSRIPTSGPLAGPRPVLLRFRCTYPGGERGSWFVRAPDQGVATWTWKSQSGEVPDVERDGGLAVNNDIIVVPILVSGLLYLALVAAAIAVPLLLFGKVR